MDRSSLNPDNLRVVGNVFRPERGYNGLPGTTTISPDDGLSAGLASLPDTEGLLLAALTDEALRDYVDAAVPLFEDAVDAWIAAAHVPFKSAVRTLFRRVWTRVFFGVDDPRGAERWGHAIGRIQAGWAPAGGWLRPVWWRARRTHHELLRSLRDTVGAPASEGACLLARLQEDNDQNASIDDDALTRLLVDLMTSTFGPASAGVASMAYLLATHDVWRDRLQVEALCATLDRVAYQDLEKLDEHAWVWAETLRLYPWVRMRSRPLDSFDPERFARLRDERGPSVVVPFGVGAYPRSGAALSDPLVRSFWHTFGTRASYRLASPYRARPEYRPLGIVSGDVVLVVDAL